MQGGCQNTLNNMSITCKSKKGAFKQHVNPEREPVNNMYIKKGSL